MAPEPRFLSKKSAPAPCRESFPTRMSPERTDETLFRPLRRPELCEANMEHKRVTLFAGHYGSGKTNIAVNYALYLRSLGKKVAVAAVVEKQKRLWALVLMARAKRLTAAKEVFL